MIRRGYGGGALSAAPPINENGADDPFETLFAPAKPALDAVIALWSAMSWLGTQRQSKLPLFDPAKVGKLIKLIPTGDRILEAQARFRDAAYEPAPEAWTHLAIGLMLQSMPAAADIHDSYRCGIVDSLYRDPVVTEGLDPGFSAPVIVRTIRELRRKEPGPPPASSFIEACMRHRRTFRRWVADMTVLADLRYRIEDQLEKAGRLQLVHDPDDDLPFD